MILAVFWDMKGPITIDFLKEGGTINLASNCQLLYIEWPLYKWYPKCKTEIFTNPTCLLLYK